MGYITSRKDRLPRSAQEMSKATWYNMWITKKWPYGELLRGDLLYWYEPPSKRIIWRTHIKKLERFRYSNKAAARRTIERKLGPVDSNEPYYQECPEKGYCVAFRVGQVRKVRLSKSSTLQFSPLGWERVTEDKWLGAW